MRPTASPPLLIRGTEFGGPKPLICVPLVASDIKSLLEQAEVAHKLAPDVVEWRADSFGGLTSETAAEAMSQLRRVLNRELLIFTLRIKSEGGNNDMSQVERLSCIQSVLRTGKVDLVDIELCNGLEFIATVKNAAKDRARIILSFHDFTATPSSEFLYSKLADMVDHGADIAKIACMPQDPGDVLRLLEVTLRARKAFPSVALCTMSMGGMGVLSRVAGFLYGSDMAFAVAREVSAPGQIPLAEARGITESLLRYA
jgi:3-dehydroquinate dehydratase-1